MKLYAVAGVVDQIHRWTRKAGKVEVVGWLVGYWADEDLVVLDVVLSKNNDMNHATGAEGAPEEESELSLKLPRGVGIVGLFHSQGAERPFSTVR